jgi:large subunit ribosomal protein L18
MGKTSAKVNARLRRKKSIRKRLATRKDRLRLAVFRSARHIYAQIVDDERGVTLAEASSMAPEIRSRAEELKGKKAVAGEVGRLIAERAKNKGLTRISFDRGGYLYHGRVKALADSARKAGLEF